jgi:L-2-hydroxycarboxylate dehydrogenase (NAD+)
VVDFNADEKSGGDTGHFIIALDIARFTPLKSFAAEQQAMNLGAGSSNLFGRATSVQNRACLN